MAYKWTEGSMRTDALLDADEVNREYNNYKNTINGGFDRENIPNSGVDAQHLKNQAFWLYNLPADFEIDDVGSGVGGATHVTYDDYAGGWKTVSSSIQTIALKEGMLQIDVGGWFTFPQAVAGPNQKWIRFQVLLDNSVVARTGRMYAEFGNVSLNTSVPVAGGLHTASLQWQFSPPTKTTTSSDDAAFFGGCQMLLINRYR